MGAYTSGVASSFIQNNTDQTSQMKRSDGNNTLGKDAFFKLLITQLQNQDPLKPMKDTEFIAQMAQFSSLEQMQNMNEKMGQFLDLKGLADSSSLIGKNVQADVGEDDNQDIISGQVDKISFTDGNTFAYLDNGNKVNVNKITEIY